MRAPRPCTFCGQPFTPQSEFLASLLPYCSQTHMAKGIVRHWRTGIPPDNAACTNRTFCQYCQRCLACAAGGICPRSPDGHHSPAPLMTMETVRALRTAWEQAQPAGVRVTTFAESYAQQFFLSNYDIRCMLHGTTWRESA